MSPDRWPARTVRVGPFAFRLRSPLPAVMRDVDALYRDYPADAPGGIFDYAVAVRPASPLRRFLRPKVVILSDIEAPLAAPQPAAHGLLALEMGMNLQVAAGMNRLLLLHAGAVERDGGALILSGDSGAGKSTLSAILGHGGWRFLGDEFALIDPASGSIVPFPRPVSLKNESIALLEDVAPADRFGPRFEGTIKGSVRHLAPPPAAIAAMDIPARPRLFVVPSFTPGAAPHARPMGAAEAFVRLTQSSTNYRTLGETGFDAVLAFTRATAAYEIIYGSSADARTLLDQLWAAHG